MIRQARTYMTGAVSATALIAAAVVVFVLLVSFGALRDWPLAGLGGSAESTEAPSAPSLSGATPGDLAAGPPAGPAARAGGDRGGSASNRGAGSRGEVTAATGPTSGAPAAGGPGTVPTTAPGGSAPPGAGDSPASSASGGSSGGGDSSGGGGESGGGTTGGGAGSKPSTSQAVTDTVNDTVSTVDTATGGALGQTGVPQATEEVVNGVAGPESIVGQTVDKTVEAVGGLLGDGR